MSSRGERHFNPTKLPTKGNGSKLGDEAVPAPGVGRSGRFVLLWVVATGLLFCCDAFGQSTNAALPPPANVIVDFDRDIRPVLDRSCLRCHGPERPRSGFRLVDRESALKGGYNNTNDIVPGNSAESMLIHYVAGLDEMMIMPPEGEGDRLTPEEIGLLRAWIDQGAAWSATGQVARAPYEFTPALRWVEVDGDRGKFREMEGVRDGWVGGVEHFRIVEPDGPDRVFIAEGHFLTPESDYEVRLSLTQRDFGFVRMGFHRWRRYYDDTGGYYEPFTPPAFDLDRELHLDTGRAWIDFGLTLPNRPRVVLGYEFQFRDGAKSMLEWGFVNGRNIYPALKGIDETVHIVKLDVTHEWSGWSFEDNARLQVYGNKVEDLQVLSYTTGPLPDGFVRTRETLRHLHGANTIRIEKQVADWWLLSAGHLYSRFSGDTELNQATLNSQGDLTLGSYWNNRITLKREMHAFSVASLLTPARTLSVSLGAQSEFTRQEGYGDIGLDFGDPTIPGLFFPQPGTVRSDLDQVRVAENASVRYTRLPFTTLFADARFEQDRIGQFERADTETPDAFLRDTDYANNVVDARAGFSTSPWRWLGWNAHYRWRRSASDYDHSRDESFFDGRGYSAFIREREITTDSVETRLVLRPVMWLKAALTYEFTDSAYEVVTDPVEDVFLGTLSPGGRLTAGDYEAHVFGVNVTFAPTHRLLLNGAFTYSDSRTVTAANDQPAVVPYEGNVYTISGSGSYQLTPRLALRASYAYSQSSFGQDQVADRFPLGLDHRHHRLMVGLTRQLTEAVSATVRYQFYKYDEPSSGRWNDFEAHGVFATLLFRWESPLDLRMTIDD
ncbi:MAG TPA: hypothetical protein GYA07_09295 [Verrucomicrobia bacterium]|nr:hypothetical protein [Verrucomicrobiota bacterium]HOP97963.1 MtrB/PioB family outer membrane beta-barrel protein [Verrucomicrobiota bacterium]